MEEVVYWLWLSRLFSYGSDKPHALLKLFGSPEQVFHADGQALFETGFLSRDEVAAVKTTSLDRASLILEDCTKENIQIVPFNHPDYPERLKNIYGAPVVLYVKGDISGIDDQVAVTVVGTRNASDYGRMVTGNLSYQLARAGAVIISGCAVGIDAYAHMGALKAGGRTIAVLGCGLDVNYPAQNAVLKQNILKKGALISELPPKTQPTPKIFPVRNRLMAALGLGVLVTEAPVKSGSLITADFAMEQGKDLFCVPPHNIFDEKYSGVAKYIRDGAISVFSAQDILFEYFNDYAHKLDADKVLGGFLHSKDKKLVPKKASAKELPVTKVSPAMQEVEEIKTRPAWDESLSSYDKRVYDLMSTVPKGVDAISVEAELPIPQVLAILTQLELLGYIASFSGRRYALSNL